MSQLRAKPATSVASRRTRVHLGCGLNTPEGWVNVDGSWNARLARYPVLRKLLGSLHIAPRALTNIAWDRQLLCHDLRKVLPFADNSVEAIYASHLVEHLYHEEAKRLLQECFRVLKPAGVLRLVVPSLETIVAEYMGADSFAGNEDQVNFILRADRLNARLGLRRTTAPGGNLFMRVYKALTDFDVHKWMYDAESLIYYVQWAGFEDVKQMEFRQSRIGTIADIELPGRVLHGAGTCIEGIKPLA
jgi:SAM-dependent methyltransferase